MHCPLGGGGGGGRNRRMGEKGKSSGDAWGLCCGFSQKRIYTDICPSRKNSSGSYWTLVVPQLFSSWSGQFSFGRKVLNNCGCSWESSDFLRRKWMFVHGYRKNMRRGLETSTVRSLVFLGFEELKAINRSSNVVLTRMILKKQLHSWRGTSKHFGSAPPYFSLPKNEPSAPGSWSRTDYDGFTLFEIWRFSLQQGYPQLPSPSHLKQEVRCRIKFCNRKKLNYVVKV